MTVVVSSFIALRLYPGPFALLSIPEFKSIVKPQNLHSLTEKDFIELVTAGTFLP
ncbi:MAG: hypothetical protein ACP5NC_06880 [Nitrososphaeria archaeon]